MSKLLYEEETYQIRAAIFDVYKEMGCGFLEAVYQECLEKELTLRGIPFVSQKELTLRYKGMKLDHKYKPDLICFDKIILELKAAKDIAPEHEAQTFNYLKVTGMHLALIVNFGHFPQVQIERIII